jgi:hypothetical protein
MFVSFRNTACAVMFNIERKMIPLWRVVKRTHAQGLHNHNKALQMKQISISEVECGQSLLGRIMMP